MGDHKIVSALRRLRVDDVLQWILERRWAVLAVLLVITAGLGLFIPRLTFNTSVYDLVIEDLPENDRYNEFRQIFGSEEIIRVVIKAGDVFDLLTFQKIEQLAETARKIEGVARVISLPAVKRAVDLSNNWPMEKFKAVIAGVPLFQNNLLSDDHSATLLTLVLSDKANHDAIIDAIRQSIIEAEPALTLYQVGMPLISRALARYTEKDFLVLPPLTFVLIAVMLFAVLRNIRYVLLPLACVTTALAWTFGFMGMIGIPFSLLTMIVPVFLIAVGTAYCLHILAEHRSVLDQSESARDAVIRTFAATTFPTVLAVFTTIIGLNSLFFNRITAIKEFALIACIGMTAYLVVVLTLLPIGLSTIKPRPERQDRPKPSTTPIRKVIDWIIAVDLHHHKAALIILGSVVLVCFLGMLRLKVETNPVGYFKADTEVSRNFHDIYQHLSGSFPLNVVLSAEEDFFENPEHLALIETVQNFIADQEGVDKTISFADYMKLVNYATNRFEPEQYKLPTEGFEVRMLVNSYRSMLGADMLTAFMDPTFSKANILLLTHISSSGDILALRDHITNYAGAHLPEEVSLQVTGFGVVISASSQQLTIGQVKSLSITMVVIFGIMLVLFLSYKVGLVAIIPNFFPIVVNFGIMGWLGIELSMATSLIASVAIGLAVDDTIHYMVRFNREFRIDLNEKRALETTLSHIGRPIIYTTVTIGIGFSILMFSSFSPTAVFGAMMVITMLAALVGDLILLPILMQRVEVVTLWDLVRLRMGEDPEIGIPLFNGLTRTEVHSIIIAGTIRTIAPGEALFFKGEHSETMYAVIDGAFDVIDYDPACGQAVPHGIQKTIAHIKAGDILGEMGLLRSVPRSATVIATAPGELLPINWKMIKRLQWLYPPTAHKFFVNLMSILCERVERLTTCLANESTVDDMTGLNNRKGFCQLFDTEAARAKRYGHNLYLGSLDIVFDKPSSPSVADDKNKAICEISRRAIEHIRRCDLVCRIDTDRFVFLFPAEGEDDITPIKDRLHRTVAAIKEQHGQGTAFDYHLDFKSFEITTETDAKALLEGVLQWVSRNRRKN
jgi:predicted RND superfamily exporter protein/GGDEF domain-containing protein